MLITILMSGKLNWKGSCAVAPGAFATGIVKVEVKQKRNGYNMEKMLCVKAMAAPAFIINHRPPHACAFLGEPVNKQVPVAYL